MAAGAPVSVAAGAPVPAGAPVTAGAPVSVAAGAPVTAAAVPDDEPSGDTAGLSQPAETAPAIKNRTKLPTSVPARTENLLLKHRARAALRHL